MEYFSNTLRQPKEIEKDLGIPVLATLPTLGDTKQKILGLVDNSLAWLTGLLTCAIYAVFAILVFIGDSSIKEILGQFY